MAWTVGQPKSYGFFGQGYFGAGLVEASRQGDSGGGAPVNVRYLRQLIELEEQDRARQARADEEALILALLLEMDD